MNKKVGCREIRLKVEIEHLKQKMEQTFLKKQSLQHPEILRVSRVLDQKIVEYTRYMKKQNRESNIPEEYRIKVLD